MSAKSQTQTIRVEVGVELMKFVLGYDLVNLKELRERFPTLKINNGKRAIYIEGSGTVLLDKCRSAVSDIIIRAMSDKENSSYKKRVEKEIESKRRAAAAANRIRDNIENELKSKHRDEITECLAEKMGIDAQTINIGGNKSSGKKIASGMFAGLEIEESDDEIAVGDE
jgi:hypothetical protein